MKNLILVIALCFCSILLKAQTHLQWAHVIDNNTHVNVTAITPDGNNNLYTAGIFDTTADFDPGPATYYLPASPNGDIFISKMDAAGNLLWAKSLATADSGWLTTEIINAIAIDPAGNSYYAGVFGYRRDFDPGPDSFFMTPTFFPSVSYGGDGFVLKLDPAGNFVWAKQLEGSGILRVMTLALDGHGNLYIGGGLSGQTDFDPGIGVFNMSTAVGGPSFTDGDAFLLKLDTSGVFKWAGKVTGDTSNGQDGSLVNSIAIDASGNIWSAGIFFGEADFDAGAGSFMLTQSVTNPWFSSGAVNGFIWKVDSANNFVWAGRAGGTASCYYYSIATDPSGDVYVSGEFYDTLDTDPGPAVFNLVSAMSGWATFNCLITKLDNTGSFIWAKQLGGTGNTNAGWNNPHNLVNDNHGYLYCSGSYYDSCDFDPGPGVQYLTTPDSMDRRGFVAKLDTSGNLVWAKSVEGSTDTYVNFLAGDATGNIYAAGNFKGQVDVDLESGSYNLNATGYYNLGQFVAKYNEDSCANLTLVLDSIADVNCTNLQGAIAVHAFAGTSPYSYIWNTTPVSATPSVSVSQAGIYQVMIADALGCSRTAGYLVNAPGTPSAFDLEVNIAGGSFHPGFTTGFFVNGHNDGCVPATGTLKLLVPAELTYNNAVPVPDQISGDTLIWNFSGLTYDSADFVPYVSLTTDLTAVVGSTIYLIAYIDPAAGDANPANNVISYWQPVTSSFDPNDIAVYPGTCEEGYVLTDSTLRYTINFQNTGTAAAANIFVTDTLDANLDISTVKIVSSSHPVITEAPGGHALLFRLDNVALPDSNANEPASHGYVIFEASPLPNLPLGTEVRNKASIYFDFNFPVITNETLTTYVNAIPACVTSVTGTIAGRYTLSLYPNPASGIVTIDYTEAGKLVLTNMVGRLEHTVILPEGSNRLDVNFSSLAPGVYTYTVYTPNRKNGSGKLVILK